MKYNFSRKINLANIDKDLFPYETEDVSATDADSFDEAKNAVERFVAERIGYYRAQAEAHKQIKTSIARPVAKPVAPAPAPAPIATPYVPPASNPVAPVAPEPGTASGPPAEFNI